MKRIKLIVASLAFLVLGSFALVSAGPALAYNPLDMACSNDPGSAVCQHKNEDAGKLIGTLVNTLLFLVGILSVIMIIVGGIWYTTSSGDASRITRAKNTLTYAIVGLVVAFVAYAIVNWILKLF